MLGIALLAQYAGTFDVSDATSIRARVTQPTPVFTSSSGEQVKVLVAADLSTTAEADLRITTRATELTIGYAPLLMLPDLEVSVAPLVFQRALVASSWKSREVRVALTESATFGRLNSELLLQTPQALQTAPAPGQPSQGVQPAPTPVALNLGSSATGASLSVLADRRTTLGVTGNYVVSGGLAADDQQYLPLQSVLRAAATDAYALSARELLTTIASVQRVETTGGCPSTGATATTAVCRETAGIATAQEELAEHLSAATLVTVAAGVAGGLTQSSGPPSSIYLPTFRVALTQSIGRESAVTAQALLGPVVDFRTGLISNRFQSTLLAKEALTHAIALELRGGLLKSTSFLSGDTYPLEVVSGSAEVQLQLDRAITASVGAMAFWQTQAVYGTFSSEIGYLGVSVHAPQTTF